MLINDYLMDYDVGRFQYTDPRQFITTFSKSGFICPRCGKPTRQEFLLTRVSLSDFLPCVICDECKTIFAANAAGHIDTL